VVRGSAPPPPSRDELRQQITGLIEGTVSREAVTAWAMQWLDARDPGVDDRVAWEGLNNLAGADAPTTDREYLYERVDFEAWRDALAED
jgi:hypothetical protein